MKNFINKVLITGASGYIGSCTYFFLNNKFKLSALDKVTNSNFRINKCNLLNKKKITSLIKVIKPDLIIHLAAQSLVDEKINKKKYYQNNIIATKNLIEAMEENTIRNIIFSSTAALYKVKNSTIDEKDKIKPISTYAKTKYTCEKIIRNSKLNSVILRFFNVCSALTEPKLIGELHNPETHLIPTLTYKNLFKKKIFIYGNNYNTKDGTCIRDYVHVSDICRAIHKSINLFNNKSKICEIINIGGSNKITNLEIIKKIETITKKKTNYTYVKKRKGDVSSLTCSIKKAKKILIWRPLKSNIKKIIQDEIKWINYFLKQKKVRKFKNYN